MLYFQALSIEESVGESNVERSRLKSASDSQDRVIPVAAKGYLLKLAVIIISISFFLLSL